MLCKYIKSYISCPASLVFHSQTPLIHVIYFSFYLPVTDKSSAISRKKFMVMWVIDDCV